MSSSKRQGKMRDGVIQRSSGRWAYVIRVLDVDTGKTKPRWVGGFPTQREAKAARATAVHEHERGQYVERKSTTLGDWLDEWLDVHETKLRPATAESYRRLVRLYVKRYPIAHTKLQQLTGFQLTKHWAEVHTSGGQGGKALSARTVRFTHTVVSKALSAAVRDKRISSNPATDAELPKQQRATGHEKDAWTPESLRAFLDATADDRLHPLWVLLAYTGMRRGEALALRWTDVDDDGTIHVRRSVAETKQGRVYDAPKNGEQRTVRASQRVRDALRTWRKTQAAEKLSAGPVYRDDETLVFTMPDGRPVAPGYATKTFAAAVRAACVYRITLHGLRHTAATLLLRDGASVHLVARMLGHKDPSITLSVYSHAIPGDDDVLADSLERIIGA